MDESAFTGEPVSKGIGIGELYVYEEANFDIDPGIIADEQVNSEISKLDQAIRKTLEEIDDLKASFSKRLAKDEWFIFDAFRTMLEDKYFIEEVKDIISHRKLHAENAVDTCIRGYIKAIQMSENDYAQQSIHDLNDIGTRIIRNIIGETRTKSVIDKVSEKHIVLVRNLNLTLAASFGRRKVSGIVYESGAGYLSHAAIVLRGLGIPAVNGIKFESMKGFSKCRTVLDGDNGRVIVNPDNIQIKSYKNSIKGEPKRLYLSFWKNKPTTTKDGFRIGLSASVGSLEECEAAADKIFKGIGLVRTEVIFTQSNNYPDEAEQYLIYSKIAKKMGDRKVVIRTADIGGDKNIGFLEGMENHGGKVYRGLKFFLSNKDLFYTQLRAIIRAGENGNVAVAFPMVNSADEIREAKKVISKVKQKLSEEGRPARSKVRLGAFIETKQGIENLDSILHEVDFISIGTNDLLQQVMGVDRKESTYNKNEFLHPRFLRQIKYCIDKARKNSKLIYICGEMVADFGSLAVLLGMGAYELSISPSKKDEINDFIKEHQLAELKRISENALVSKNIDEVTELIKGYTGR